MNIVIKKNRLISKLLLGGCVGGVIYLVKQCTANSKKFKEHKEATLANYDIDKEIQEASINNEVLSAENRADAKIILEHKKAKLECASSVETFDMLLKNFKSTVDNLKSIGPDDTSRAEANLIYEKAKMEDEIRRKEIAAREQAELNKIKLITSCINNVMKMISPTLTSTAGITVNI